MKVSKAGRFLERPSGNTLPMRGGQDTATIAIGISRLEQKADDAFASARSAAAVVLDFLTRCNPGEFGSSRVTLSQEFRYSQNEQRFVGYKARITYTIVVRDLDRIEEVLTGVISAGANELSSVQFETSRLKELRADARRQAVTAAREKAELYCREAGVAMGKVIAIEDTNPDQLSGRREGHVIAEAAVGGAGDKSIDPAMITVGASVFLTFAINN